MKYHFDTTDESAAVAALLVYAVWRSRDISKFKVTPEVWEQATRFIKASAKRAETITQFLESLMPRFCTTVLKPKWLEVGYRGITSLSNGEYMQSNAPRREFLTGLINESDHAEVISRLFNETAWVVLLVRDRLEHEKRFENDVAAIEDQEL